MITDVPGVRVGHWTNEEALTGCTVVLMPSGTTGSVVVPGGAPATRETDAIAPGRRVDEVHADVMIVTVEGEQALLDNAVAAIIGDDDVERKLVMRRGP